MYVLTNIKPSGASKGTVVSPPPAFSTWAVTSVLRASVTPCVTPWRLQLQRKQLQFPAMHVDADVAPTETEYVPALQLMHVDANVAPTETEDVPALQLMHVDGDVAPTETEYVPALQLMHTERPTAAYLPA